MRFAKLFAYIRCVTIELVGTVEIAALLGVSRQRAQQLTTEPAFPEPAGHLSMGKVWTREAVETWLALRPSRKPGPKPRP